MRARSASDFPTRGASPACQRRIRRVVQIKSWGVVLFAHQPPSEVRWIVRHLGKAEEVRPQFSCDRLLTPRALSHVVP